MIHSHSPGPYVMNSYELHMVVGDVRDQEHGYYVQQLRGRLLARFPFATNGPLRGDDVAGQQRANALLYLAAPDLLSVVKRLTALTRPSVVDVVPAELWVEAQAAVALAEGRLERKT